MTEAPHILPRGTRLNDLYEIEEKIAEGGIGIVYRARDVESGDPVAIKVLHSNFACDPVILDLFKREAKILRKLKHEALTHYFVFTKEPTLSVYYLAMEFVEGPSLGKRLEAGPLSPDAMFRLIKRVASALQTVHDRDVIHRDLSPDNIILQNGDVGQAKIIDFGIARSNTAGPTIIGDGFAGKINYVSPEQVGLFDGKVTPKSDIYSLGLVIAEALTGKQADMGGTQVQMIEKRRTVPFLDGIDSRFLPLLRAMLQPDPALRPASMREIAEWTPGAPIGPAARDATVIRVQPQTTAEDETAGEDENRPASRWIRRVMMGVSMIAFAGIGAAAVYYFAADTIPEAPQRPVLVTPTKTTPSQSDPTIVSDPPAVKPTLVLPPPTSTDEEPKPSTTTPTLPVSPTTSAEDPPRPTTPVIPVLPPAEDSPVQEVQSPPALTAEERIRKFVVTYPAGDCVFLQPTSIGEETAMVEGFASTVPPFLAFDKAFKAEQGFEAKIQVNLVMPPQCPAIDFLRATPSASGAKTDLSLGLERTVIPSGGELRAHVGGIDASLGDLVTVMVREDGTIADLTPFALELGGNQTFAVPLNAQSSNEEIGLIIAMVGPGLRDQIQTLRGQSAAEAFTALVRSAAVRQATATTVKITP